MCFWHNFEGLWSEKRLLHVLVMNKWIESDLNKC